MVDHSFLLLYKSLINCENKYDSFQIVYVIYIWAFSLWKLVRIRSDFFILLLWNACFLIETIVFYMTFFYVNRLTYKKYTQIRSSFMFIITNLHNHKIYFYLWRKNSRASYWKCFWELCYILNNIIVLIDSLDQWTGNHN